jgi:hypothetical protein
VGHDPLTVNKSIAFPRRNPRVKASAPAFRFAWCFCSKLQKPTIDRSINYCKGQERKKKTEAEKKKKGLRCSHCIITSTELLCSTTTTILILTLTRGERIAGFSPSHNAAVLGALCARLACRSASTVSHPRIVRRFAKSSLRISLPPWFLYGEAPPQKRNFFAKSVPMPPQIQRASAAHDNWVDLGISCVPMSDRWQHKSLISHVCLFCHIVDSIFHQPTEQTSSRHIPCNDQALSNLDSVS